MNDNAMNDNAETMKTYVAEINGEAIIAFRAMDDDDANDLVSDKDGDLQQTLNEDSGLARADGSPLWDGKSKIIVRPATEAEDETWRQARDADEGEPENEPTDSETEEGPDDEDDFDQNVVYLIPVKPAEEEGEQR